MRIKFKSLPLTFYVGVCLNSFGSITYTVPLTGYHATVLSDTWVSVISTSSVSFCFSPSDYFGIISWFWLHRDKAFPSKYKNLRANLTGKACVIIFIAYHHTKLYPEWKLTQDICSRWVAHRKWEHPQVLIQLSKSKRSLEDHLRSPVQIVLHLTGEARFTLSIIRIMIASYRATSQNKGRCKSKVKANEGIMNRCLKL